MMRAPLLICGMAGIALLAGCADTPTRKVASTPPAPASPWIRDTRGNVVTLASLTGKNPQIGQTEGLADSTPGATALEAASTSSDLFGSSDSSDIDNLEIVGDGLKGKLVVLRVGADRNDSDLLSVFAGVKNETARKLEVEMQTLYRDKDGHALSDGQGSWIPLTLKPHEQTQYRSVALTPDATDFLVRIRHAPSASANSEPQKPSGP